MLIEEKKIKMFANALTPTDNQQVMKQTNWQVEHIQEMVIKQEAQVVSSWWNHDIFLHFTNLFQASIKLYSVLLKKLNIQNKTQILLAELMFWHNAKI